MLEFDEGLDLRGVPLEGCVFAAKLCERLAGGGEGRDESAVEVAKAKEGLDIFQFLGLRPIGDGFDLCLIHLEALRRDDEAKELHAMLVEF